MRHRRALYLYWGGLTVVFLLALFPRLVYPVSRHMLWYDRSVQFWDALQAGDLEGTYQQYHPGVTTMWVAGFGIRLSMATHGWSSEDLLNLPPLTAGPQGPPAAMGVAALSIVIAGCIALVYVLLARLTNWPVAFSAGCLLALDPFYITHSKMLHVDALLASFMLVSALFLITYLQERKNRFLALSGVFAGLAFLTKSSALFLIPFTALILALQYLMPRKRTSVDPMRARTWASALWEIVRSLALWGIVAVCVFFMLWPAMWSRPAEMLSRILRNASLHAGMAHPNPNFFAGRIYDDPGPLYYLASLAWKSTLITLPAVLMAFLFLIWRRKRDDEPRLPWFLLIFAGGFVLQMTFGSKKWARYILPAFAALDIVAAWGLVQLANAVGRRGSLRQRTWIPAAIIVVALIAQTVTALRLHPYYGTHHNLLLGGSRVAQHILHLGDQGEGYDLAASFLNDRPGAELVTAGVMDTTEMFQDNYLGQAREIDDADADYRVFFINSIQRQRDDERWGDLWETCQETGPVWQAGFDGVPYIWICAAYPRTPEAFAIDHHLEAQLGDHVRLLGYALSSSDISAGDALTVTLFWQSDGDIAGDYHVFTHLQGADESMVAQHDGVPVDGERPTWSWQDQEVLQDKHTLDIERGLSEDTYTLSVGMYDYVSGKRLPVVGPDGEHLAEGRMVLDDIVLTSP
jgi:hypothetical protein